MNANNARAETPFVSKARQIVRQTVAGKVPIYYYPELGEQERTHGRGKPRPYLVAGAEILRLVRGS